MSCSTLAKDIIYSSVSPEFPNGLHSKYIKFISNKLNVDPQMIYLPYARRIIELQNGNIDILCGLQENSLKNKDLIYLEPSYETTKHTIFVKAVDQHLVKDLNDINKMAIAVTINGPILTSSIVNMDQSSLKFRPWSKKFNYCIKVEWRLLCTLLLVLIQCWSNLI